MNKIYRVIWNAAKGVWQCVSEFAIAKGKSKSKLGRKQTSKESRAFILTSLSLMLLTNGVWANTFDVSRDITTSVTDPGANVGTPDRTGTYIGTNKPITFTIKDGGIFTATRDVQIVQFTKTSPSGTRVTVTGTGQLRLSGNKSWLDIGSGGYAYLDILNGGTVVANGFVDIGSNGGTTFSVLTIDSANSSLWVENDLVVGDSNRGYGRLIIQNGGKVTAGGLISTADETSSAVSDVIVNNGTITITDPSKILFDKMDTSTQDKIEIQSGGLTLITNGTANNYTQFDKAAISGEGALTKQGEGNLIFAADNTYSGGTNVTAGLLQLGNGTITGKAGSGKITLSDSTTLALNHGTNDFTLDNSISGSGKISQLTNNTGTTTITNDNTEFTGNVEIHGGTLQVGSGSSTGDIGKGTVTVNSGSNLKINHSNSYTLDNTIGGEGNLIQAGNGTTIVTKDNTYTGTTTINSGTLQVGSGSSTGDIGKGTVTVNSGSNLKINHSNSYTLDNTVTGAGNLEQAGSGKTSLDTGKNYNYTGKTTVSNGELDIVKGAVISQTSDVFIGNGSTYTQGQDNQAKLTVNGALTTSKTGENDYGDVEITHGQFTVNGTATVGNIKSTQSANNQLATVNVAKDGVLTTNLINDDVLFQNFKTTPAPDTVTVDGTWNANVASGAVKQETDAAFTGNGTLNKTGSGTLTLDANNKIGNANINDGEISVNAGKSLAITNNLTVGDGKDGAGTATLTNAGTVTADTVTVKS
ncbi:hypothetical protein IE01_08415, partial [Gallibacterium anatis DSM 16844 = F 149]